MFLEELDLRQNAGVTVRLLWDPASGAVFVQAQIGNEPERCVEVAPELAAEAFRHPYAYLPREAPELMEVA